jgi:hypothetical protein
LERKPTRIQVTSREHSHHFRALAPCDLPCSSRTTTLIVKTNTSEDIVRYDDSMSRQEKGEVIIEVMSSPRVMKTEEFEREKRASDRPQIQLKI